MRRGPLGWVRLWSALEGRVNPRVYLLSGLGLAALKYGLDAGAIYLVTGRVVSPLVYLAPTSLLLGVRSALAPEWLLLAMAAWTLPFLWVGVTMSVRRALDAGLSPWLGLVFFVPVLNYALMTLLSVLPSRPAPSPAPVAEDAEAGSQLRAALIGVGASVLVAVPLAAFCTLVLRGYGLALFVGTPFLQGAVGGFAFNRGGPRSRAGTLQVAALSVGLAGGALLVLAVEGAVCLAMALPLAVALAALGALLGRAIALTRPGTALHATLAVLALPALAAVEGPAAPGPPREVVSVVEVDAPPEVVWRHVLAFGDLPEPPPWLFRLGIAYPQRARIAGEGVGALRHCEFSTGPFVEPITAWEPPRRLAFDVTAQPLPMTELSPYGIRPPHVDGYFRAVRGEFLLVRLDGGRTRLEGRTWYELDLAPAAYWRLLADALLHAIHLRVLDHVKALAEQRGGS